MCRNVNIIFSYSTCLPCHFSASVHNSTCFTTPLSSFKLYHLLLSAYIVLLLFIHPFIIIIIIISSMMTEVRLTVWLINGKITKAFAGPRTMAEFITAFIIDCTNTGRQSNRLYPSVSILSSEMTDR